MSRVNTDLQNIRVSWSCGRSTRLRTPAKPDPDAQLSRPSIGGSSLESGAGSPPPRGRIPPLEEGTLVGKGSPAIPAVPFSRPPGRLALGRSFTGPPGIGPMLGFVVPWLIAGGAINCARRQAIRIVKNLTVNLFGRDSVILADSVRSVSCTSPKTRHPHFSALADPLHPRRSDNRP